MAKLNIDEFNKKYAERITDNDDLLIELMEDFTDSISNDNTEEMENLRNEINQKKEEINELKQKYKDRFLNNIKEIIEDNSLVEEKEYIDVKEI